MGCRAMFVYFSTNEKKSKALYKNIFNKKKSQNTKMRVVRSTANLLIVAIYCHWEFEMEERSVAKKNTQRAIKLKSFGEE